VSTRLARLNEQLKRELSELIRAEVRDPRVGIVTITGVDTAADLGSARVFVRAIDDEALPEMLEGLQAAAPFLRTKLGRTLHIRKVPELRFQEDRSLEGARRIEEVLAEVLPEEDDAPEDGGAVGEGEDPGSTGVVGDREVGE
jgi:ribosome-binding factor A